MDANKANPNETGESDTIKQQMERELKKAMNDSQEMDVENEESGPTLYSDDTEVNISLEHIELCQEKIK